jgi:tetratricopeptide (TPR) repeat protein
MIQFISADFQPEPNPGRQSRCIIALCILVVLIFLIYSNSFQASWHFDDYENIVNNARVQIRDLQASTLFKTFFASPEGKREPSRPAAYLSFALNAYVGGKQVFGYHAVNIAIHIFTAFLLFMTVLKLYETPNLIRRSSSDTFFVALLTATLWAANPIQTQAVTYIVQRMAAMAALFCMGALYCYIAARLTSSANRRIAHFIACGCCYGLAVMSKENAALLPLSMLLVEFIFFRDLRDPKQLRLALVLLTVGAASVVALGALIFGNPFGFLNGYPNRTFTPFERLLTETRVLVHYLSQIFYPVPTRLSLYHDVVVSKSILNPWTTLPSLLMLLALIGLGFKMIVHRPLISFAILFFFLNHAVESTVIGLELVFEHRNYLPSLFIFMPVAAGIERLIRHYGRSNIFMRSTVISGVVLLVVGFGSGTYIRNQVWADERTLWEDTLAKAPNSIRAHHELAYQYYEKTGNYDGALFLYHRGLNLSGQNVYEKTLSLNNIASIHFTRGDYTEAEKYWQEAIASYPKYKQAYYRLALTQTKLGKWQEASATLSNILFEDYASEGCFRLKGIILLHEKKPDESIDYFRKAVKTNPEDWQNLMYIGLAHTVSGRLDKAHLYLSMAGAKRNSEPLLQVWLAQNRFVLGLNSDAKIHLDRFIELVGARNVEEYYRKLARQFKYMEPFLNDLRPLVAKRIQNLADDMYSTSRRLVIPTDSMSFPESEMSKFDDTLNDSSSNRYQ